MADTKKYVVTHEGMTDKKGVAIEIGTVLELTAKAAKARKGKVEPKGAGRTASPSADQKKIATQAKDIESLTGAAEAGTAKISDLEKQVETLTSDKADLEKQVETLTSDKADLEKQVKDLTAKAK